MIAKEIRTFVERALKKLGITETEFVVEHPTDLKMGDYSTNVGIKTDKAKEIFNHLAVQPPSGVERVDLAGPGFINFYLSKEFFKENLKEIIDAGENFGKNENLKSQKFFIEHTQPNPFKTFHIGHLMNNTIGESIARIVEANGAEVKTASYHGDVGMHVAKTLWKGDYAAGAKAFEDDPVAKKEIEDLNRKIYDRSDPEINAKYDEGRKKSLEEFKEIYKRLGTKFDFNFFESETAEIGKKIVLGNIGKVFEESEGAIIFKGEKAGLHTRVFLNSDKLPTYEAKEVGLAKIKKEKFPFDLSMTVTANEQDAFFDVVEAAIGEVFPELKGKLKHLSHGMLRLPTGKMSSRTGDIITAEELIEEVKGKVKDDEQVAIGAIKYMILRQAIGNDIVFDFEKSVSTEGDSGVYLQYAHARANSILEKAKNTAKNINLEVELPSKTREVEKLLYRFPEIVERAGAEYAPNYITTYLTKLASAFNNFYAHEQIIGDPYRLAVTQAFQIVMKNGLNILGIPAPERM
ncbi:MAG: arginine--tRNA ligase [Candidatus Zambryskibacteria bacterium]|nr:arginine--tRNA ligase [Candidatus Zambryskibacteria bacterium]